MQTNQVPYATILDGFLFTNHITILFVGCVVLFFSYLANNPDTRVGYFDGVRVSDEYFVGGLLFILWILENAYFGYSSWANVMTTRRTIEQDEQLELLDFNYAVHNSRHREISKKGTPKGGPESTIFKRLLGSDKHKRKSHQKAVMGRVETLALECTGADAQGFFYDCGNGPDSDGKKRHPSSVQ